MAIDPTTATGLPERGTARLAETRVAQATITLPTTDATPRQEVNSQEERARAITNLAVFMTSIAENHPELAEQFSPIAANLSTVSSYSTARPSDFDPAKLADYQRELTEASEALADIDADELEALANIDVDELAKAANDAGFILDGDMSGYVRDNLALALEASAATIATLDQIIQNQRDPETTTAGITTTAPSAAASDNATPIAGIGSPERMAELDEQRRAAAAAATPAVTPATVVAPVAPAAATPVSTDSAPTTAAGETAATSAPAAAASPDRAPPTAVAETAAPAPAPTAAASPDRAPPATAVAASTTSATATPAAPATTPTAPERTEEQRRGELNSLTDIMGRLNDRDGKNDTKALQDLNGWLNRNGVDSDEDKTKLNAFGQKIEAQATTPATEFLTSKASAALATVAYDAQTAALTPEGGKTAADVEVTDAEIKSIGRTLIGQLQNVQANLKEDRAGIDDEKALPAAVEAMQAAKQKLEQNKDNGLGV